MKRTLLFLTSAIAAGALTGFLISDFPKLTAASTAEFNDFVSQAPPESHGVAAQFGRTYASSAFGRVADAATAALRRVQGRPPKPTSMGLLLREHVVVVQGGSQGRSDLPKGTAVDLVKNEGRFLSVRHDQTVVTIPRSAVMLGVVRTN